MQAFLVPLGGDRYELYCEPPDETASADDRGGGPLARVRRAFRQLIEEAERHRRHGRPVDAPARTVLQRLKDRVLAHVATAVAEQRLLWRLRHETVVSAAHPDDLTAETTMGLVRASLQGDYDKHRFWFVMNLLGGLLSLVFILVPGPNLIGYYFAFRLVGHFLSLRGARRGLRTIRWEPVATPLLSDLRRALGLPREAREARVAEIAAALGLEALARFVDRAARAGA